MMMYEYSGPVADGLQRLAKPIRYLYYRIYTWNLRKHGESDFPQYNALLGTSFLMLLNLLSIPLLLDQLGISAIAAATFRTLVIALIPITIVLHYLLLIRHTRFRRITEEFANESDKSRWRGTAAVWGYVIFSFALFFGVAMIGAAARS